MCGELCTDNRFEIIAAYKKKLIEATNIEDSPEEMAVIDNILFRFWQMDWLPKLPHGRLIDADVPISLIDTRGEKVEVTVAHIIEKNRGIVKAVIPAEEGE